MASLPSLSDWYRQAFEQLDDGFCLVEPIEAGLGERQDYRIIAANRAFQALLGTGGKTFSQHLPLDQIGDTLDAALSTGAAQRVSFRDDARKLTLDISITHVANGLALILRDVTDRSLQEETLRQREKDFVRVQRIGEVGGLDIDITGGLRSWRSPEYLRLHGLPPDAPAEGHADWRARVHPDDRDLAEQNLMSALSGKGVNYDGEYRIVRPSDGAVRWINARADIERDAQGRATRLLGVHLDITERKRLEQALREGEDRQAFLLRLADALRSTVDPAAMQQLALSMLATQIHVDRALIYRAQSDHIVEVECEHGSGIPTAFVPEWRAQEPICCSDVHDLPVADRSACVATGLRAFVTAPVIREGRTVGGICVQSASPRIWTPTEVDLVAQVAERCWTAVQEARSAVALRQSTSAMRRNQASLAAQKEAFQIAMNGGPLAAALGVLAKLMTNPVQDGCRCTFFVADESGDQFVRVVGLAHAYAAVAQEAAPSPEALACERAMASGKPVVTADISEDEWWRPHAELAYASAVRACWSFPIETAAGRLVGSFALCFAKPSLPSAADIELAEMITQTAAIIISYYRVTGERMRSEERFRQFGDASRGVLWIRDAETLQWQYLTPAFETIYGLSRKEACSGDDFGNWLNFMLPEDRPDALASIEKVRGGAHVNFEYRIRRASDGAIRWLRNIDFPMRNEAGRVSMIGGISEDVTDAKLAQQQLERSEGRLRSAVEVGQLGLWDWNVVTGELHWSDEHFRMEGYDVGEVTPSYENWAKRLHPDDRKGAENALKRSMELQEDYAREFRVVHPDGTVRWLAGRGRFFYDKSGRPLRMIGAMVDTTERREWEERQAVLVAELQHRVRNILSVVRSVFSRTMEMNGSVEELANHFKGRLDSLARTQIVVTQTASGIVDLETLIRDELLSVGISDGQRLFVGGPHITLPSRLAEPIGLAIHELTTNALKYGALRFDTASLSVEWSVNIGDGEARKLNIIWTEHGVPVLSVNPSHGFGSELIEEALPYRLGADTSLEFRGNGIRCTISVPLPDPLAMVDP